MEKIICGIERDIPYDFQGKKGVTNRLYVMDSEVSHFRRDNGSSFTGQRTEFIKVRESINISEFMPGDVIRCYYNRFGQVEEIVKVGTNGTE